jgi:hypothetical protein
MDMNVDKEQNKIDEDARIYILDRMHGVPEVVVISETG